MTKHFCQQLSEQEPIACRTGSWKSITMMYDTDEQLGFPIIRESNVTGEWTSSSLRPLMPPQLAKKRWQVGLQWARVGSQATEELLNAGILHDAYRCNV